MTYTAHDWTDGDVIHATDIDRIENGLAAVSNTLATTSAPGLIQLATPATPDTDNVTAVTPSVMASSQNDLLSGVVMSVVRNGTSAWGPRPTTNATTVVLWIGAGDDPANVTSGTGGMYPNDLRILIGS